MSPLPLTADVLLIGQGLAGSTLAWRLAWRGLAVVVVDRGGVDHVGLPTASRVAAGLITPVTGKRLTVAPDYATHRQSARSFYRRVEQETGRSFLEEKPAVRILSDAEERQRFIDRGHDTHATAIADGDDVGLPCEHGAFRMPAAARLDVPAFLHATAQWLGERRVRSSCDPRTELGIRDDEVTLDRLGIAAKCVVLCTGHAAPPCRWMDGIDFSPAKGEVLTIRSKTLSSEHVLHAGGTWIAPEGDRVYRVGSTTEWYRLDATPTEAGKRELLRRLAEAGVSDAEVIDHQAAVRPATPDRRPTYGFSAAQPRIGWFNGLGAKGALWAPWHADRMAELVCNAV